MRRVDGNHPTQFSAGPADEVAVYDRALSAETIRGHFQIGSG